ncbi:MAG TPA: hypothetical protein VEK39_06745 [Solirubrobacterales bacterium]|nr:hypothetical protein [Solirubrobacterales bacterium]
MVKYYGHLALAWRRAAPEAEFPAAADILIHVEPEESLTAAEEETPPRCG